MATNNSVQYCEYYFAHISTADYSQFEGVYPLLPEGIDCNTSCTVNGTSLTSLRDACLDPLFLFRSRVILDFCDSISCDCQPLPISLVTPSYWAGFMSQIVGLVNSCLQQYCQSPDPTLGGCPYTNFTYSLPQNTCVDHDSRPISTLVRSSDSCNNLVKTVNSDLGGVGIYLAYLTQLSLALIAGLLFLIFGPFRSSSTRFIATIMSKTKGAPSGFNHEKQIKKQINKVLKQNFKIITSLSVDLQETQCFFILASLTAVSIAVYTPSSTFPGATNLLQLQNNYLLLFVIEMCGLIPIALMNFMLLFGGNWSIEIALLSFFTATASIFVFQSISHSLTDTENHFSAGSDNPQLLVPIGNLNRLDKCGYNSPPLVYCVPPATMLPLLELFCVMISAVFCIMLTIGPFIFIFKRLVLPPEVVPLHSPLEIFGRGIIEGKFWDRHIRVLVGCVTILSIIGVEFYVLFFLEQSGAITTDDWSVGQMISVWAFSPVIWKSTYAFSTSLIRHFSIRVPWPYKIVREPEFDAGSESDDIYEGE